jgi:acyl-coenzyme A synthetase/AMP-(fatty) acid ligase
VKAVAVAAVPDAVRGDEVMACVVPQTVPADADARERAATELVQWCLSQLAYYKAPGHVAFVDALPLTATNKIQRGELKGLATALVDGGAAIDTRALKKRDGGGR